MTDTDILNEMIKDTALVRVLFDEYDKPYILLNEPQVPNSDVTICRPPVDAVIIRADAFSPPKGIFKGDKGECKRADFVIISAKKRCILYIELKKTKIDKQKIIKQLKGTQCFVKYCREIAKVFWNKSDFLDGYESRFLSIGRININKGKTKINRNNQPHNIPEKMMRIYYPGRLQFNHIAGL